MTSEINSVASITYGPMSFWAMNASIDLMQRRQRQRQYKMLSETSVYATRTLGNKGAMAPKPSVLIF